LTTQIEIRRRSHGHRPDFQEILPETLRGLEVASARSGSKVGFAALMQTDLIRELNCAGWPDRKSGTSAMPSPRMSMKKSSKLTKIDPWFPGADRRI